MGGVLIGGREACVACISNFKPLTCLVAEISAEKSFPIVTVSQGPTIGFRCEPAVHNKCCFYQAVATISNVLFSGRVFTNTNGGLT